MGSVRDVFSKRLKEERSKKGLTQRELAEKCDCKQVTISNTESGKSIPDLTTGLKIAQALGVSLDWLCGNEMSSQGTTAVTWLTYMKSLIDDAPRDEDGRPMIRFEPREEALYFDGAVMTEFFKQYAAIESIKQAGTFDKETILGLHRAVFERYKDYFTPGYKMPVSDFADLEDEADEKVPF